jgi:hypothetical protein
MYSVEEDDTDEGRGSGVDAVAEEARRESRRRTAEFMEGSRPFLRSEVRYSRNACSERRRGDEGSCGLYVNGNTMRGGYRCSRIHTFSPILK